MKKILTICAVTILAIAFCSFGGTQWTKNQIGELHHMGTCPICGDTWWHNMVGAITDNGMYSVMVCNQCLAHPDRIDPEKAYDNLIHYGWDSSKAARVKNGIVRFKNGECILSAWPTPGQPSFRYGVREIN